MLAMLTSPTVIFTAKYNKTDLIKHLRKHHCKKYEEFDQTKTGDSLKAVNFC